MVDDWKRTRLVGVGADFVIPNYLDVDELLAYPVSTEACHPSLRFRPLALARAAAGGTGHTICS